MATKKQKPSVINKADRKMIQKTATELLKLFGPNGKHWITDEEKNEEGGFCLIGGLDHLGLDKELLDPFMPLNEEYFDETAGDEPVQFESTPDFNDRDGWTPVKKLLTLLKRGIDPSKLVIGTDGSVSEYIPAIPAIPAKIQKLSI